MDLLSIEVAHEASKPFEDHLDLSAWILQDDVLNIVFQRMMNENYLSNTFCRNFIRYLKMDCRILLVKRETTEVHHQRTPERWISTVNLEEM